MKKNIKMILEYDGSRYDGWQKQGNTEYTIQGKLEAILQKWSGEEIEVQIKGRHDPAIVHRARVVVDSAVAFAVCDMLALRYGTDWLKGN